MMIVAQHGNETYWLMVVRHRVANTINDFGGAFSAKRSQVVTNCYELNVCKRSDPLNYLYSDVRKKESELKNEARTIAREIKNGYFRWEEGKC